MRLIWIEPLNRAARSKKPKMLKLKSIISKIYFFEICAVHAVHAVQAWKQPVNIEPRNNNIFIYEVHAVQDCREGSFLMISF
jgi:hypothetical protein